MARIQGILFDLGDTVIEFGPVDTGRFFSEGARLSYQWLSDQHQPVPSFKTFLRRQMRSVQWHYLLSRLTSREFNSLELIGRLSRDMGQTLSSEQLEHLAWLWYEPLSRQARIEPGLTDLLEGMGRQGYRLGLVSNTFVPGHVLDRHLEMLDLLRFFPVRIYSCNVRVRKPDPAIFDMALRAMNLGRKETIFVGDSLKADIGGANRCGIVSVLKDPSGRKTSRRFRPTHRVRSLQELPQVLSQYEHE